MSGVYEILCVFSFCLAHNLLSHALKVMSMSRKDRKHECSQYTNQLEQVIKCCGYVNEIIEIRLPSNLCGEVLENLESNSTVKNCGPFGLFFRKTICKNLQILRGEGVGLRR
jgi:hypothetical protein